jgi:hypothetical protein
MPYIPQEDRWDLRPVSSSRALSPGELNYQFTELCKLYLRTNGTSYGRINDVIGALEGAKQEFYRRVAAPYEDEKIKENGDVYDA